MNLLRPWHRLLSLIVFGWLSVAMIQAEVNAKPRSLTLLP